MRAARTRVCALSIAGLDPGGGAGILADARAFSAAGAFACAVVAVDTVQSTAGLIRAWPRKASEIIEQAEEVRCGQRLGAVKTGALGNAANVEAVAAWASLRRELPLVVDPVLAPTRRRGTARTTRLADDGALAALRDVLLPRATPGDGQRVGGRAAHRSAGHVGEGRGRRGSCAGRRWRARGAGEGRSPHRRRGDRRARDRRSRHLADRAAPRHATSPRRRVHAGGADRGTPRRRDDTGRTPRPTPRSSPRSAGPNACIMQPSREPSTSAGTRACSTRGPGGS